jgi:molecular chaperone GrpE
MRARRSRLDGSLQTADGRRQTAVTEEASPPEVETIEGEVVTGEIVPEPEPIDPHVLGLELPDDHDAARQLLLSALAESRDEASRYLDDLRRVAADFDNFRKRALRDQGAIVERASERVVQSLLPVLDSLDAAMAIEPETETERKLLDGVKGTFNLLLDTLGKEGLAPIEALGMDFDPTVHEAVAAPGGGESDLAVTQELRRGYMLGNRVLRPTLVVVDQG